MLRYETIFEDVSKFILYYLKHFYIEKDVNRSRFGDFLEVPKMIKKVLEYVRESTLAILNN